EDRVFDKEQMKRLRVAWDKPKRWVDFEDERTPYLEISGRLSLLQVDGQTLKPVDWPYPIVIVIARKPNKKPDWSRRHDFPESEWSETLIGRDPRDLSEALPKKSPGSFAVQFDLGMIATVAGKTTPFQVGLCFGEKRGKKVSWSNVVPVL